ncbi:nucleoside triphosphate pyrophosphohydrolase [Sporosarcina sp. UB5]|uniref:nucleoside triphosphate pyrophosphohydrolase n=1 Tax=Sporosarcina sp. UB5 TaxID=3047463 RepID=UPI003D79FE53
MPVYNKLVRDKILEIIEAEGLAYNARILESSELLKEVKAKMIEEAKEFYAADTTHESVEELADVLELVLTALSVLGVTYEELEEVRQQKKEKRGGFEKAIYLIDVEDK